MKVLQDEKMDCIKIEVKILDETVETYTKQGYDVTHFFDMVILCREIAKYLHRTLKILVQIEILGLKVTQGDVVIFETIEDYEQYLHENDIVLRNKQAYVKGELYSEER